MKKIIFVSLLFSLVLSFTFSQQTKSLVTLRFKNGSLLPRKLTVISYAPSETGNGTQGFFLWPLGTKELTYQEGTRLYLADQKTVDVIMDGKSINDKKAFLIVEKKHNGQVFKF